MVMWDVLVAGRVAQLRRVPRPFAAITAFGGLLIVPALLIAFASQSILYGRAIQPVAWVWPVTTILFALQATYALTRRLVTEKDFGFVAVEGDWPECFEVNRCVKHRPGASTSPRQVLDAFSRWPTWMWANEDVAEFLTWLHARNAGRPPSLAHPFGELQRRVARLHPADVAYILENLPLEDITATIQRDVRKAQRALIRDRLLGVLLLALVLALSAPLTADASLA